MNTVFNDKAVARRLGAGVVFLLFGGLILWQSIGLTYETPLGPGPGFFGVWLGTAVMVLSAGWAIERIAELKRRAESEKLADSDRPEEGYGQFVIVSIALCLLVAVIPLIGYQVPVFVCTFMALRFLWRRSWILSIAIALVNSVGLYFVFRHLLGVRLPTSGWGF